MQISFPKDSRCMSIVNHVRVPVISVPEFAGEITNCNSDVTKATDAQRDLETILPSFKSNVPFFSVIRSFKNVETGIQSQKVMTST